MSRDTDNAVSIEQVNPRGSASQLGPHARFGSPPKQICFGSTHSSFEIQTWFA